MMVLLLLTRLGSDIFFFNLVCSLDRTTDAGTTGAGLGGSIGGILGWENILRRPRKWVIVIVGCHLHGPVLISEIPDSYGKITKRISRMR